MPDETLRDYFTHATQKYPGYLKDPAQDKMVEDDLELNGYFWKKYRPELQWGAHINLDDGLSLDELAKARAYIHRMEVKNSIYEYLNRIIPALIFIYAYPLYLLVRFIIWAIKTLKVK